MTPGLKDFLDFILKALTAIGERLLFYFKGRGDEKAKHDARALQSAQKRMEIDWIVSALPDHDLDSELGLWMRRDKDE